MLKPRVLELISPPASDHHSFAWTGGLFETGQRGATPLVEGAIGPREALVMVTLRGGARRLELVNDDGQRHAGPDRPGAFTFLPADCGRRQRLHDVAWHWASLSLPGSCFDDIADGIAPLPITAQQDRFVHTLMSEMSRLYALDGRLDAGYCEAMSLALVHYLSRRYWDGASTEASKACRLTRPQLRRVADYVDARLGGELRIRDLAVVAGLSVGHFHRAFRSTTGLTPLQFIMERRVEAASRLLADPGLTILDVALGVGLSSPSHFARTFRSVMGMSPSEYRHWILCE